MRQGAASPPAERPSGCLPVQHAVPRAGRGPHCRASWLPSAACRPQHGSASQRRRGGGMSDAHSALLALPASTCPASTRPASGVRRPEHVLRPPVRCPRVGCPRVWYPVSVSDVQSPVSDIGCPLCGPSVRHRVRVRSIAQVSSCRARVRQAATRLGTGPQSASHPTVCRVAGCGRLRVGRQDGAAGGQPRPESLGHGSSALGSPLVTARACAAPVRPKAAGGPSKQSGPVGVTGSDLENRMWACQYWIWDHPYQDNQALIVTSQNVDNSLQSWAFGTQ